MEKAKLIDVELAYEVTGSGEPVLLISTGPIADSFLPLASTAPMAEQYRLIRYRQRRASPGTREPAPVSFAQHAADAAALLGYLGIARAHVAGHSTGAAIALQLAVDEPQKVATLTLLEPPLVAAPGAAAFFEQAGPALAAYASGDRTAAMAAFLSAVCSLDWKRCRAAIDRYIPGGADRALEEADNFFGSYLPALNAWQFGAGEVSAISQPVLSVLGTHSEQWFAEGHRLLHQWLPQLEGCEIEGVAHLLHVQNPQPVARCMAAFLARHPLTGAQPKPREPIRQAAAAAGG